MAIVQRFMFLFFVSLLTAIIFNRIELLSSNPSKIKENHKYIVLNDFVTEKDEKKLMKMFESIGKFESSKSDFSSTKYVQIGEGYEPSQNGSCHKHGTLLHKASNQCLFLPRIDAVQWYMKRGGYEGWKERIPKLTSRISSFIRHEFNAYNRSEFQTLFGSQLFIQSVSTICPATAPYVKPIELNLNLVLPGQGFLAHNDAVYFLDASRHQFPLWLLAVMKASNLFNDRLLRQIQAIVYIGPNNKSGGELYIYPHGVDEEVVLLPPSSKSSVIMDGTEVVHGTVVWDASKNPLPLWQNTRSFLQFDGVNNVWRVFVDDKATENVYEWTDVRGSIAFRALCFEDERTMNEWNEYDLESELTVDAVMEILKSDMIKRGRITESKWDGMNGYDLGLLILSEYIKLPKSELSWIPFNYCLILDILPKWMSDYALFQLVENIWC